jgi:hypothetical protein
MTLSLVASNWSPTGAEDHLDVSWDRGGYILGAGERVSAVITLTVSADITGIDTFSFQMVIEGTG